MAEAARIQSNEEDKEELQIVLDVMESLTSVSVQLTCSYVIRRLAFFPDGNYFKSSSLKF